MKKVIVVLELEVSDDFVNTTFKIEQDDVVDGIVLFRENWEETPEEEEQFKIKKAKIKTVTTE